MNLHLRAVGSPGWRYALLFPAWLLHQVRPYRGAARRINGLAVTAEAR